MPLLHWRISTVAFLAALGALASAQTTRDSSPRERALGVELQVDPTHPFRYAQGTGPYSRPSLSLDTNRRAFAPGETVALGFRTPSPGFFGQGAPEREKREPLPLRARFTLHDLDGALVTGIGLLDFSVPTGAEPPRLNWHVPELDEGRYFLAAEISTADGERLVSRSDVVFIAPDYPTLLAAAETALEKAKASALPGELRRSALPSSEMLVEDARMRFDDFGEAPRDWEFVERQLQMAREDAEVLLSGRDPWRDRRGALVRAYRSDLDGTLQPYALFVPRDYDPDRSWPLLVSLHGATSSHLLNRRRVFGLGNRLGESDHEAVRNEIDYPDVDFVVVSPYGRGEIASYADVGEDDVLQVMDRVESDYSIDPDRIHLTGLSMGGVGTWSFGLLHPDRFASISPVCAPVSWEFSTRELTDGDRRYFRVFGDAREYAENALNHRVRFWHGDEDPAVPVDASRQMARIFEELGWLGKTVDYFELPGVHHFAWDFSYRGGSLFDHLKPLRRERFPERVVFSTPSARYGRAYWVRIDSLSRGMESARIEAVRSEGAVSVTTRNVSGFSVLLTPEIAAPGTPLEVRAEGEVAFRGVPQGESLSFERDAEGGFHPVDAPATGADPPDHVLAGPYPRSLATYRRHAYVYGTGGDAALSAASKSTAEGLANWGPFVRASWPVVADVAAPDLEDLDGMVLVGDAATNAEIARVADRLALRSDAEGLWAGDRRIAGPGSSFRLSAPDPDVPGRHLLVVSAVTPEGFAHVLPSPGGGGAPGRSDYVVANADGEIVLQGYFEDDWTIP